MPVPVPVPVPVPELVEEATTVFPPEMETETETTTAPFTFGLQSGQGDSAKASQDASNPPCPCKATWTYANVTHHGCEFTHDSVDPWCDIALPAPATCTEEHVHRPDEEHSGGHLEPWTFCEHTGEVREDLTMSGCHCKPTWSYFDTTHSNCAQTHDSGSRLWCFVVEGDECASRVSMDAAEEHAGGAWDWCALQPQRVESTKTDTTVHHCHCQEPWTYHNVEHHGCAVSPDSQSRPWCYVREGEDCQSGYEYLHGEHVHWDWCWEETEWAETKALLTAHLCHCKPEWSYEGQVQKGCMALAEDPTAGWCPVLEEEHCVEGYTMSDAEGLASGLAEGGLVYYDFCSPSADADVEEPGVSLHAATAAPVQMGHSDGFSLEPLRHQTPEGGLGVVR